MPPPIDHRHIIVAQELVSSASTLHDATFLGGFAVAVDPIWCLTSIYYHKTPTIFLPHLVILHFDIVALRAHRIYVWTIRS